MERKTGGEKTSKVKGRRVKKKTGGVGDKRRVKWKTDLLTNQTTDQPKKENPFHFMRLPPEIRQRVYKFYFSGLFKTGLFMTEPTSPVAIIPHIMSRCICPPHESQRIETAQHLAMPLCRVSRPIRDEALRVWFETQEFNFACCCELSELRCRCGVPQPVWVSEF